MYLVNVKFYCKMKNSLGSVDILNKCIFTTPHEIVVLLIWKADTKLRAAHI
jgi:hypothetical protein